MHIEYIYTYSLRSISHIAASITCWLVGGREEVKDGEGTGEGGAEGLQRMSTTEEGRATSHESMRVPLSNLAGGLKMLCLISCWKALISTLNSRLFSWYVARICFSNQRLSVRETCMTRLRWRKR